MAIKQDGHFVTVQQHVADTERAHPSGAGDIGPLISAIALATKIIASYVRRAGLVNVWGSEGTQNIQGETVQKLDVIANETLKRTLGYWGNVGVIASEEDNEPRVLQEAQKGGKFIVMFDPLDGSSNIDANVSIGTIFTILGNTDSGQGVEKDVLQPGIRQLAAGYVVYGSSTAMVYSMGHGVNMFTLDPQFGAFLLTRQDITMPDHAHEYSVNEAYLHTFPEPYQRYLGWAKHPDGGQYSSRYIGSLVADFHRILIKGGVFLYPPTVEHPKGKLRLMYEANPLAYIAEQAGGMATNGKGRLLEVEPDNVHDRTPLIIGSKQNVEEVMQFVSLPVRA